MGRRRRRGVDGARAGRDRRPGGHRPGGHRPAKPDESRCRFVCAERSIRCSIRRAAIAGLGDHVPVAVERGIKALACPGFATCLVAGN